MPSPAWSILMYGTSWVAFLHGRSKPSLSWYNRCWQGAISSLLWLLGVIPNDHCSENADPLKGHSYAHDSYDMSENIAVWGCALDDNLHWLTFNMPMKMPWISEESSSFSKPTKYFKRQRQPQLKRKINKKKSSIEKNAQTGGIFMWIYICSRKVPKDKIVAFHYSCLEDIHTTFMPILRSLHTTRTNRSDNRKMRNTQRACDK